MDYRELSSKHWTLVLESLPTPISLHDESGKIVWANRAICELYSKPLHELTGLTCEQAFRPEHPSITTNLPRKTDAQNQESLLGNKVWSVSVIPLSEREDTFGFLRIMSDVTAERNLQSELLNAEKLASLGQMVFGIAHNIGTPLNIISGYAEFLLMRINSDERGYKELSAILDQTKRVAGMLNDALDLARSEKRVASAIDVKVLLSESLDLAAHYFRRREIRTQLACATSIPLVYGEAPRLRQAFFSLLLNVGQCVPRGGRVEVAVAESADCPRGLAVRLSGTDETGQEQDFSPHLGILIGSNEPTKTSAVGLSLAREALDDIGAAVRFDSFGDHGIAVVVQLPVRET